MMAHPMRLDLYENSEYSPGRNKVWQAAWMFLGAPLLRCYWLPSSRFRAAVLRAFGAKIGTGVVIRSSVAVKYPWHLSIGDHSWIGEHCWIDNLTTVDIGHHVCISQGAYFCAGNHNWSDPAFGLRYAAIHVDDAAWIGAKAIVHAGSRLCEGAVLTAGSIASGTCGPWKIFSGQPARCIRERKVHTHSSATSSKGA